MFRRDGKCLVTKVQDKVFAGKDIIHAAVFKKGDDRMVYNLGYTESKSGVTYVKRFQVTAITRDREYELAKGGGKTIYFTANPNAEAEVVSVKLTPSSAARLKVFDYDFAELDIKGRESQGNILTKYPVKEIKLKTAGTSTMGGLDIWFDEHVNRLNTDKRGRHLGNFEGDDRILAVYNDGSYELTNYEITNRYENLALIEKFNPATVISAVHFDGSLFYVKRFRIETTTADKKFPFITENRGAKLIVVTTDAQPQVEVTMKRDKKDETATFDLDVVADVKGWKSVGNRLSANKITSIKLLASKPVNDKKIKIEITNPEKVAVDTGEAEGAQLGMFG